MSTPYTVSSEIVVRLYRLAGSLRKEWAGAPLREDFDTSQIMAVVKFLERVGNRREDGVRRSHEEQIVFAERLLRQFWGKVATRDKKRHDKRMTAAGIVKIVSLDIIGDDFDSGDRHKTAGSTFEGAVDLYAAAGGDIYGGETGRATLLFLQARGWKKEAACAMVWRLCGRSWDDVAYLLEERFEIVLTPGHIRQWQKKFNRIQADLQRFLRGDDDNCSQTVAKPGTPPRLRTSGDVRPARKLLPAETGTASPAIADASTSQDFNTMQKETTIMQKSQKLFATINVQVVAKAGVFALLAALPLTGCSHTRTAKPSRLVVCGLDTSVGWYAHLAQGASAVWAQAQVLNPDVDSISISRVDTQSYEFTGEFALDDPDRLCAEILHQTKTKPSTNGTYPVKFFRQAAAKAEAASRFRTLRRAPAVVSS